MTHQTNLVGSSSGGNEALKGLLCGTLYGLTSPLLGHPLDTLKSKMQAQVGYMNTSATRTLVNIYKQEGFLALYRGLLPPLLGSSIFRSVQFSAYALAFSSSKDSSFLTTPVPGFGGMEVRVLTSGLLASTARALIEVPLEFIKVRRQTGQTWRVASNVTQSFQQPVKEIKNLYKGFSVGFLRTWALMGMFFIFVDQTERHLQHVLTIPYVGPFFKGGICATAAWVICWPFEVLKNQIQAGTPGVPKTASSLDRAKYVLQQQGIRGLYRGIGPGTLRSLLANGSSMIVYSTCQNCFREDAQQPT